MGKRRGKNQAIYENFTGKKIRVASENARIIACDCYAKKTENFLEASRY